MQNRKLIKKIRTALPKIGEEVQFLNTAYLVYGP